MRYCKTLLLPCCHFFKNLWVAFGSFLLLYRLHIGSNATKGGGYPRTYFVLISVFACSSPVQCLFHDFIWYCTSFLRSPISPIFAASSPLRCVFVGSYTRTCVRSENSFYGCRIRCIFSGFARGSFILTRLHGLIFGRSSGVKRVFRTTSVSSEWKRPSSIRTGGKPQPC